MILTAPAIIRMKRLPEVSVKMICHLMESWVRDGNYGNAIWGMLTSFAPHSGCEIDRGRLASFWQSRFSRGRLASDHGWLASDRGRPASAMAGLLQPGEARFSRGRPASDHECGANEVSAIVRHSARSSFFQNANIAKALQKSKDH